MSKDDSLKSMYLLSNVQDRITNYSGGSVGAGVCRCGKLSGNQSCVCGLVRREGEM